MGTSYTICDPYLFTLARWMEADGVESSHFSKVHDHLRHMSERPAVKRVLAQETALAG
jgi:glutathione S-transferase